MQEFKICKCVLRSPSPCNFLIFINKYLFDVEYTSETLNANAKPDKTSQISGKHSWFGKKKSAHESLLQWLETKHVIVTVLNWLDLIFREKLTLFPYKKTVSTEVASCNYVDDIYFFLETSRVIIVL